MLQIDSSIFQELTTKRLIMSKVREEDVNEIFYQRSDETMMKYLDKKPCQTIEEALNWIRLLEDLQLQGASFSWALRLKEADKLIGTFNFWNIRKEHYRSEIGYTLHPNYQGKGLMLEALTAALDFGFSTLCFHSVEANVNPANLKSIKLLESSNFVKEAHFKENYYYDGKFLDSAIYSLLASKHFN